MHGERHLAPAAAWAGAFVLCGVGDWLLGRWVFVPVFVAAFYGGMIVIDLLTYPMLSFWRGWLRRRGLVAWYLVEVVGMWGGTTLLVVALAPWWLSDGSGMVAVAGARWPARARLGRGGDVGLLQDGLGAASLRGGTLSSWIGG